jgi:hypothetical protein
MVVYLGPLAQMFAAGQVPSSVPANSEVMLNGAMTPAAGPDAQHLEIHICSRKSGEVVVGVNPTITLTDTTTGIATRVEVATMEGVGAGQSDLHYGNNVTAPVGHSFAVTVDLSGESATLRFNRRADDPAQSVPATSAPLGTDSMSH